MRQSWLLWSALGLIGCGASDSAGDGPLIGDSAPEDREWVASAEQPLTAEYNWAASSPPMSPVTLMPAADWGCFFTRVGGRFEDLNDYVRIRKVLGDWTLGGSGRLNSRVQGGARCLQIFGGPPTTGSLTGVNSPGSTVLNPVPGVPLNQQSCFLMGIGGRWTPDTFADITLEPAGWTLKRGGFTQGTVTIAAMCARLQPAGVYSWSAGSPPTNLGTAVNRGCFLGGLAGAFASPSDIVQITKSGMNWQLNGLGAGPRFARASCVPD